MHFVDNTITQLRSEWAALSRSTSSAFAKLEAAQRAAKRRGNTCAALYSIDNAKAYGAALRKAKRLQEAFDSAAKLEEAAFDALRVAKQAQAQKAQQRDAFAIIL